jgi:haloalkane dehalogenase
VAGIEQRREGDLSYREATPDGDPRGAPVLLLHGYPESSYMWRPLLQALAASGRRAIAPDLYGLGDSDDDGPATWERNVEALTGFHAALALGRVTLVVHDWGGFVGLAWACDHPDSVASLVISSTGFFTDGRWHGMAAAIRSEKGEELVGAMDRQGFDGLLRSLSSGFDDAAVEEYWRPFDAGRGQRTTLEFYRSMDFEKLEPYQGRLAELDAPALILWGESDEFAPLGGARRFESEIGHSHLVAVDGAGHFVYDDVPERCASELLAFLDEHDL